MSEELNYKFEKVFSKLLNQERNIFIWIPEDYNDADLPVLYLLDGGMNERFMYVIQLVDELIKSNRINPLIVVGIENINRNFDFTRNTNVAKDKKWVTEFGNAENFAKFLALELIYFIKNRYKTNGIKAIVGESLGGLLVMDLLYSFPGYFDYYIAIDPSLWWNNQELLGYYLGDFDYTILKNKKLWISSSKTVAISKFTDQLDEKLKQMHNLKTNWNYMHDVSQNHFTIFKSSIENALIWTFKNE
ncbi:alpha/beta hydrolase [Empedobacter brevis]|uniref:alpha/beta hydrolase n=1 Tax=Empedobacter brevis TaxID=247 RepID=UPI002FE00BF3